MKIRMIFPRRALLAMTAFFAIIQGANAQNAYPYYSPVDSIIYLQFVAAGSQGDDYIMFRIRDEGARIERVGEYVPGLITTSVRTPGWLFTKKGYGSVPAELFVSQDYGETWEAWNGPHYRRENIWQGKPGENEGESFVETGGWMFHTEDNWNTYDSLFSAIPDSVAYLKLSFVNGLIYGDGLNDIRGRICTSSDTGRTWFVGHENPVVTVAVTPEVGAPDELWGRNPGPEYFYMLSDTGGTADSILAVYPPWRPSAWWKYILPTGERGEIYIVAVWIGFWDLEIFVYHTQDYGAVVDSTYHLIPDWLDSNSERPALPNDFAISAYPNPFNSTLTINLSTIPYKEREVLIYDLLGRQVWQWQGTASSLTWDGSNSQGKQLSSGRYWIEVRSDDVTKTKSVILLK